MMYYIYIMQKYHISLHYAVSRSLQKSIEDFYWEIHQSSEAKQVAVRFKWPEKAEFKHFCQWQSSTELWNQNLVCV